MIAQGRAAAIFHCSPPCVAPPRAGAAGAAVGIRGAHGAAAMFACTVVKQSKARPEARSPAVGSPKDLLSPDYLMLRGTTDAAMENRDGVQDRQWNIEKLSVGSLIEKLNDTMKNRSGVH